MEEGEGVENMQINNMRCCTHRLSGVARCKPYLSDSINIYLQPIVAIFAIELGTHTSSWQLFPIELCIFPQFSTVPPLPACAALY